MAVKRDLECHVEQRATHQQHLAGAEQSIANTMNGVLYREKSIRVNGTHTALDGYCT